MKLIGIAYVRYGIIFVTIGLLFDDIEQLDIIKSKYPDKIGKTIIIPPNFNDIESIDDATNKENSNEEIYGF